MDSLTKSSLTPEQIEDLVKLNFGDECRNVQSEELKGGIMNAAYKITYENPGAQQVILKVSSPPSAKLLRYEKDILRTEVRVYQALAGRNIPTPELLGYDFSRKYVDCDYFFMSFLDGTGWDTVRDKISAENRAKLLYQLGLYQAEIHSVYSDSFGYIKDDPSFLYPSWAEAFTSMVGDILLDGMDHGIDLPYDEVKKTILNSRDLLNQVEKPTLVDFDLWAANVFLVFKDGEYKISGIFDFERAYFGNPCADFTASFFIYNDINSEPEFQRGYRSVKPDFQISENDNQRMDLYRLYMDLILAIETYRFPEDYAVPTRLHYLKEIKKLLAKISK